MKHGKRLRFLRKKQGWSQIQLAAFLTQASGTEISQVQISYWERGQRELPYPKLLLKALDK